jgi:hypothetical protein
MANDNPHRDPQPTLALLLAEWKKLRDEAARIHQEMERLAKVIDERLAQEAADDARRANRE